MFTYKIFFSTLLIFAFFSTVLFGQTHTKQMSPQGLGYWEYLPPDYESSTESYPLMIFLHGLGERGNGTTDLARVLANGPPKHIKNGHDMGFVVNGKKEYFLVMSPQTPITTWLSGTVDEFVEYAIENYNVDKNRVYLTGLSLGGNGTWKAAYDVKNEPNKYAAIAVIAGWADNSKGCVIAKHELPVWAFHGDKDTTIKLSQGQAMVNAVNYCTSPVADPKALFTIYPGVGHNSWVRAYTTDHTYHNPNVYEWMLGNTLGGQLLVSLGADQTLTLPTNTLTVSGTVSSSNAIQSYSWTKESGPAANLSNAGTPTLTASSLLEGTYIFRLTVTDNKGVAAYDEIQVTVLPEVVNEAPIADAGSDQTIGLPTNIAVFNGSGSDSDGSIASYLWTKVSGPTATIQNQNTASLTALSLQEGIYTFGLTVTDDKGATGYDEVKLTVEASNLPPTVDAGSDQQIQLPTNIIVLNASASDSDGSIDTYQWTKQSGPTATLANQSTSSLTANGLLVGTYTFRVTVTDDDGDSAFDEVKVIVEDVNQSPVANAGSDQVLKLPVNSTTINGLGSDNDGSVDSYNWVKVSGPSATVSNVNVATLSLSGMIEGEYVFGLTVTDNDGATDYDEMKIVVNAANIPPSASAGSNITIYLPTNSLTITGIGSDGDGSITTYSWQKKTGPSVNMTNTDKATVSLGNLVEGTYTFTFIVTDNDGATDLDEVSVFVFKANDPPAADAGDNVILQLPTNSLSISGTGSDNDGTIVSYNWVQVAGSTSAVLTNENGATLTVSNMIESVYRFGLTVTDDDGATDYDEMIVTVTAANIPPSVAVGSDQQITLPTNTTILSATASDPDGFIASYLWEKVSGGASVLANENSANLTISGLIEGTYVFSITVTDNDGATADNQIKITVLKANVSPVANAGSDKDIVLPTSDLNLIGSGSDIDGAIMAYLWEKVSGPAVSISGVNTTTLELSSLEEGTYLFGLTVTDDKGSEGYDEVFVNVLPEPVNIAPTVDAGSDVVITLPDNTLSISSVGNDSDGLISTYLWEKSSGSTATFSTIDAANTEISDLVAGDYIFRVTVTDDDGASAFDEIKVTVFEPVVNQPPVVDAGVDISIRLPLNSITFSASVTDNDGTIANYTWVQTSGPNTAIFTDSNIQNPGISGLIEGVYTFRLTVADDDGAIASDEVNVTVAIENEAPTVDAGSDILLTLPANSISLTADAADPDGTIAAYSWTKISGPAGETITNAASKTANISGLVAGIYEFQVEVTDDVGDFASDRVKVTVETVNKLPVANSGADIDARLPLASINIYGSGSDEDGSIVSYLWTKVSGPAITFINQNSATLTLKDLQVGEFVLRITVTDDEGADDFDDVLINILPAIPNIAPTADAGINKSITLPTNAIVFNGFGVDSDGSIASYQWEKISGGQADLVNASTSDVTINNLEEGIYIFRLTVTDDDGDTGYDELNLIVNPEIINQAPTANAGTDKSISLPTNTVNFTGYGSDADGSIDSYLWEQIAGPTITVTNTDKSTVTAANLLEGNYIFRLTVEDDDGATSFDEVKLTVIPETINQEPVADAGVDQEITLPTSSLTINGKGSDVDGTISNYKWIKTSGPSAALSNIASANLTLTSLQEGLYKFRLIVTDNDGASDADDVQVLVNPEDINQAPQANAGSDQTITLPIKSINIHGSGSDADGSIDIYAWTKINGPNVDMSNTDKNILVLNNMEEGVYTFRLTVTDDDGASSLDNVIVTVNSEATNQPPIADAGTDQEITLPTNIVVIHGSGSDVDGSIDVYEWKKISGPTSTLTNANSPTLTVSNLVVGNYRFRLEVTDDDGDTSTDDVRVVVSAEDVNTNPVVDAGNNVNIQLPTNTVNLTASASDLDGTISSYSWQKISGGSVTLSSTDRATLTLTDLSVGTFVFRITVIDDDGASDYDEVRITVQPEDINALPIVDLGTDIHLTLPTNAITIKGNASDADGNIVTYAWKKITGPNVAIENGDKATVILSGMTEGTYTFQLTVTDNDGGKGQDEINVFITPERVNAAPVADAGKDEDVYLPTTSIDIYGGGSDPDGTIESYSWEKISGPPATLSGNNTAKLKLTDLTEGQYEFGLIVMDNNNATGSDFMKVTVHKEETNLPPLVNFNANTVENLPLDSLVISGNVTDPDGTIVQYTWSKLSGPQVVLIEQDDILTLKSLVEGTFIFRLTVTDNNGATAHDDIIITLNPAGVNRNPKVDAGDDAYLQLPQDTVSLFASWSDPDGDLVVSDWQQMLGPAPAAWSTDGFKMVLSGLLEGGYVFRITVTDTYGASSTDQVRVMVSPENIPPIADAGEDLQLPSPVKDYVHIGGGEDEDGIITSYEWRLVSGPIIDNSIIKSDTLLLSNLENGEYIYELTVYDNDSISSTDEILINISDGDLDGLGIPNMFSPDGNGQHDLWEMDNVDLIKGCHLMVFNRSGLKVYETNDYHDDWDGTYRGKQLPEGDYYYVIKCNNGSSSRSGGVRIIREH